MPLQPGDNAPDLTLTTHEGSPLALRDLRGRKVLIWFYPEADTPGGTAEGRGFRDQKADFDRLNITVLGASFNSVEQNAAFAQKYSFNFPLLCDTDRTLGLACGACASPKDRYAKRVSVLIDEVGKVVRVYDSVNPRDHPAQVLADLLDSGWSDEQPPARQTWGLWTVYRDRRCGLLMVRCSDLAEYFKFIDAYFYPDYMWQFVVSANGLSLVATYNWAFGRDGWYSVGLRLAQGLHKKVLRHCEWWQRECAAWKSIGNR